MCGALKHVSGVDQLFCKIDTNGDMFLLMAKVTDELIITGNNYDPEYFVGMLGRRLSTR